MQSLRSRVPRVLGALLAAATLLAAALLIAQCADIYKTGTSEKNLTQTGVRISDVYSREIVAERFARISWAFYAWAALLALTLGARALAPREGAAKLDVSSESRLERALLRVAPTPDMQREERKRRNASIVCAAVCVACAAAVCAYFLDLSRFASRDLEAVMGQMLMSIAPWIAVAFAAVAALAWLNGRSVARELEQAKAAPAREAEPTKTRKSTALLAGRIALYVAAAALIIAGIANGGMYDVLVKAINICTECIGLG